MPASYGQRRTVWRREERDDRWRHAGRGKEALGVDPHGGRRGGRWRCVGREKGADRVAARGKRGAEEGCVSCATQRRGSTRVRWTGVGEGKERGDEVKP